MKATAGEVYTVYNQYLKRYTACQVAYIAPPDSVSKQPWAVVLSLDWVGDAPLTAEELPQLRPLYKDFMYWSRDLHLLRVPVEVPPQYTLVGTLPPFTDQPCCSYGGWSDGHDVYLQIRWQAIPEERRRAFKEAMESDEQTEIGGIPVKVSSHRVMDQYAPFNSALELKALPCLSTLICERWHPDLLEFLRGNPFISELTLLNHGQRTLDLRGTSIRKLMLDMTGLEELWLCEGTEEFTHSDGVEMDFHFAIDVVTDLAAILLECSVSGSVNLQDLDEYNTPARRIRITATPEEHDAMNKALADFVHAPLEYDLSEMMDNEEIQEMARDVEALRKELYEAAGRNRDYYVKAEDMKNLLPDWEGADGCIATNRITMEGYKVGYCYRENPDGGWDSGWRFTAGDESEAYMDDPNNAGIYKLNTICNDDPDIISLLNTPAPCAFERDENGVFQQIKDWKPDEDEEDPDMDILKQCQKWHEESKQHKIIDALEAIPAEERTPEMDSELARAYTSAIPATAPSERRCS